MSKYGVTSGPYFPTFRLNTERYLLSLRIQSECGKIGTRNYSVFGHFSRSEVYDFWFSSKEINFENALLNVLLFLNLSKKFKILNDNNWAALIAPWFFISFLENSWVSGNANPWYTLSFSWEYQGLQIIIEFFAVAKTFALWLVNPFMTETDII